MTDIAWLAADWGTSRLRVWAMDGLDSARSVRTSDAGMGTLDGSDAFNRAFAELTRDWRGSRRLPVVVCGMAGAREGWQAAAYGAADRPLDELPDLAVTVEGADPDLDVRILPGLAQAEPPDVMRGEETKLLGLEAASDLVLMPGTHSKWVRLEAGRIVRFQTAMTGDVFHAVAHHTVLRHTLTGSGFDADAFALAVAEARDAPAALLRRAFGLRATDLLQGLAPAVARARLSGWLTALEIQDALATLGEAARVTIVGGEDQAERYAQALAAFGVRATNVDAEALTLKGLVVARHALFPELPR